MNCGGLTSVAWIFAKLSMSDVEMARRNLREQVMNKVVGIVPREKEQSDQGRRKDIARAFKFIIGTHEPRMVQTIGPKVQRWIDVKQGEDDEGKRGQRSEYSERHDKSEENQFKKDEEATIISRQADACVCAQVPSHQWRRQVPDDGPPSQRIVQTELLNDRELRIIFVVSVVCVM